jgi:hypothetical protein
MTLEQFQSSRDVDVVATCLQPKSEVRLQLSWECPVDPLDTPTKFEVLHPDVPSQSESLVQVPKVLVFDVGLLHRICVTKF